MLVRATPEYREWFASLPEHLRLLVRDRLDRIREEDYFGDAKSLGDGLFELRWRNGTRVYFTHSRIESGRLAILLLGGDKHGQNRDIGKARNILAREIS